MLIGACDCPSCNAYFEAQKRIVREKENVVVDDKYEIARKIFVEYTDEARGNREKHFPSFFVWLMGKRK